MAAWVLWLLCLSGATSAQTSESTSPLADASSVLGVVGSALQPIPTLEFLNPSRLADQRPTAFDRLGLDDTFFLNSFQRRVFHGHVGASLNISLARSVASMTELDLKRIELRANDGRDKKAVSSLQQLQQILKDNDESLVFHTLDNGALELSNVVTNLKKELGSLLNSPVSANLYLSGAHATALPPHTDTTDTVVIQEQGRKAWIVCVPKPEMHLKTAGLTDADLAEIQEARVGRMKGCSNYQLDVVLRTMTCSNLTTVPGDVLYIPKGIVHMARELDGETSMHLTLALVREKFSFRMLFEQALAAANVGEIPSLPVFSGESVTWLSIFQKGAKQLEISDLGISFRRMVPMWMLNTTGSTMVFGYYQELLNQLRPEMDEILKATSAQTMTPHSEIMQTADSIFRSLETLEVFMSASSRLTRTAPLPSQSNECSPKEERPADVLAEFLATSRRLLSHNLVCLGACNTTYYSSCLSQCSPSCSCDDTCNDGCTRGCDLSCDESCDLCNGMSNNAPCNSSLTCSNGGCCVNCNNDCDRSCDVCTTSCNTNCTGSCDDWCSSACVDACDAKLTACMADCTICPSSVNFTQAGNVTYTNGTNLNSQAIFSCWEGFSLSSTIPRVCQVNEQWSNSNPQCQPRQCNPPPVVPSSSYTPTTGLVYALPGYNSAVSPTTIAWSCLSGYSRVGPSNSTCLSNLSWTAAPACVDINECTAPTGNPCIGGNCTNTPGGFTCSCGPGYTLVGQTCQGQSCQPLTVPMAGSTLTFNQTRWFNSTTQVSTISNSTSTFTCTYQCSAKLICPSGYAPDASVASGISCDALAGYSSWNFAAKSQVLDCVGIPCPPSPANGPIPNGNVYWPVVNSVVKSPLRYLDKLNIVCDLGYVAVGPTAWACGATGSVTNWTCYNANVTTGCTAPTCTGRPCAPIPSVLNGGASISSSQYPATITYYCDPGYYNQALDGLIGTCDAASGQWKNGVPFCVGKPCNNPPVGTFTNSPSFSNFGIYPSTATYTCLTNYYAGPPMTTSCQTNATWPTGPTCSYRIVSTVTNISSTTANSTITLNGTFGAGVVNYVNYGPPSQPTKFVCLTPVRAGNLITCLAPPGVGANFVMQVRLAEFGTNITIRAPPVSYVTPIILNVTGRSQSGADLQNGTNALKTDTRFGGDSITITGRYFGKDPTKLTVYYGLRYSCLNINVSCVADDCTLVCTTGRGAGSGLKFRVGGGQSADTMLWSVPSVVTFSYPDGPSVSSVSGCTIDSMQPAATILCPTSGGVTITLTGKVFIDPLSNTSAPVVTVGSSNCPVVGYYNSTYLTCQLASGTGLAQTVAVMVGDLSGDAQPLLSFAPAKVTSISGCIGNIGCKRAGGDVILVNGQDFGVANAKIIIGGQLCNNVTHVNATQLSCLMAIGKGLSQLVSVLQYDGQFTSTNFTLSYEVCQPGTYDAPLNVTVCYACSAGMYTDLTNRQFCDACALGRFQPNTGQSSCTPAGYGQFVNDTGLTSVSICPAGTYSPQYESQSCTLCEPGRASNVAQAQNCIVCSVGRVQSNPGQTSCIDCPVGSAQQSSGMVACNPCLSGSIAPLPVSANCTPCLAGTYASSNTLCSNCNQGFFTDRALSSACDACTPGTFSTGPGLTFCQPCAIGRYQDKSKQIVCIDCAAGTYQQATAASYCDNCAPGSYSSVTRATGCLDCSVGYYTNAQGLTVCTQCPAGQFTRDPHQSGCLNCDPGTFSNTPASTTCTFCAVGTSVPTFGATACVACRNGTATGATGQPNCLSCDYGTAAPNMGQPTCNVCAAGSAAGNIASLACDFCVPGRFAPGNRSSACDPCPPGEIANVSGSSACITCPAGTYSPASGSTICISCPAGQFSGLPGSTTCTSCNPGSYSALPSTTQCSACLAGTISPSARMTTCRQCDVGYFSLSTSSTSCTQCPLGRYGNQTAASDCKDCVPGYFAPQYAMTVCQNCEVGSFSAIPGATSCNLCAAGYFLNISAQTGCDSCLPGTYQNNQGSTYCLDCDIGYFLATPTGTICAMCPRGKFVNVTQAQACIDCTAGSFADNLGTSTCVACDVGKISEAPAAATCLACDSGKYNAATGMTVCIACPAGTFAPQTGLSNCTMCEPGTYATGIGNQDCRTCDPGKFCNTTAASGCTSCGVGTFAPVPRSENCTSCDPGTYSDDSNAPTGCKDCPRGTMQNISAATVCDNCPPGSFGSNARMSTCQLCPAGKFRNIAGAIDCLSCSEGYFSNVTGSTGCTACIPGSYSSSIGTAFCVLCALGAYQDKSAQLGCVSCDIGSYAAQWGTSTCSKCPIGKYQNIHGASICLDCIPGKYSLEGYSECPNCQPQTANPWFGMGTCYRCADEAKTSDLGDLCICPKGSFAPTRDKNMSVFTCTTCNQGFDCTEEGVKFDTLAVKPGWWRPTIEQLTAAPCVVLAHCAGGHNSTCGPNRAGVLCAFCEPGYTASGTGKTGKCTECPESKEGSYAVIVLGSLGALVALTIIYYIVLFSDRDVVGNLRKKRIKELGIVESSEEKSSRESNGSASDLRASETSEEDASMTTVSKPEEKKKDKNAVTAGATGAETRIRPNVVYKMKIVAGFLQILTNLTLSVTMPWPTHFRDFMLIFNFLNFDFLPWGTVGCVASLEYVDKILIICSLPFFALVLGLAVIIFIHFYVKGPEQPVTRQIWRYRVLKLFAWTLFLLYPFLCSTILKYFVCRDINGEIFLVADFDVHCYSDKWYKSLPVAVIATLVYPVGIPLLFGVFLFFNRKRLDDLEMRLKFGFLVDAYHRSTWWFELVWSVNKMFCVSLVAFFPTDIQIPVAMVWVMCFVIFLLLTRPYIRKGEDRLALLCMLEVILLLMFCLVLVQYNGVIDAATDWVMSIGMIIMVCGALLVGLTIAAKNVYKIVRRWRFSWKKKHGQTNKPTLSGPAQNLVQERLEKNATVLQGRQPNSTGTASNTFEKDLAKFNFSAW